MGTKTCTRWFRGSPTSLVGNHSHLQAPSPRGFFLYSQMLHLTWPAMLGWTLDKTAIGRYQVDMTKLPTMTAEELATIRHRLDSSQREMAELLGVDLRSYQRWEYGERSIPGPAVLLARRIVADRALSSGTAK
jgi:DNA-binding transcriptional regulator YiaG